MFVCQVCLLKAYSPANRTGSPQGFYKTCTLHKHKPYSKSWYCSHKKWQIKLGDAGSIDLFGLAFQDQIKKRIKKIGQKQSQNKNTIIYNCIKVNTSATWHHMLHIPPTKILICQPLNNKKKKKKATQKNLLFGKWRFRGKQDQEKGMTETAAGLGRRTREEI